MNIATETLFSVARAHQVNLIDLKRKSSLIWKDTRKLMSMNLAFYHSNEYDNDGIIRQNNNVTVSYDEGTLPPQSI